VQSLDEGICTSLAWPRPASWFWAPSAREPPIAGRHAEIAAIDPPVAATFDSEFVERGWPLAAIGNCGVCHTREGGALYEGGYAMATPFGTIYTTNITPHPEAGIGAWSVKAFRRAMHEGLDRHG
jgi:hypothetical protein